LITITDKGGRDEGDISDHEWSRNRSIRGGTKDGCELIKPSSRGATIGLVRTTNPTPSIIYAALSCGKQVIARVL